jgi:hypothetical protein
LYSTKNKNKQRSFSSPKRKETSYFFSLSDENHNKPRIPLLLQSFYSFPFFSDNQTANHRKFAQQFTKTQEINPN